MYPPLKNATTVPDDLHRRIKSYHDKLLNEVSNVVTEKLTKEARDVVENVSEIEVINGLLLWSEAEQERELNEAARTMSIPDS